MQKSACLKFLYGDSVAHLRIMTPDIAKTMLKSSAPSDGNIASSDLFQGAHVSIAYVGGKALTASELIYAWQNIPGWKTVCPDCGAEAVILGFGGSPLSGSGHGWGICTACGKDVLIPFNCRAAMGMLRPDRSS